MLSLGRRIKYSNTQNRWGVRVTGRTDHYTRIPRNCLFVLK